MRNSADCSWRTRFGGLLRWVVGSIALAVAGAGDAQIDAFHVGVDGSEWGAIALTQVGVATLEGSLRPIEVLPDSNLVQVIRRQRGEFLVGAPENFAVGGEARIWTIGGGNYNNLNGADGPLGLVDTDDTTSTAATFKTIQDQSGAQILLDLGAAFPVNRVRFFPEASFCIRKDPVSDNAIERVTEQEWLGLPVGERGLCHAGDEDFFMRGFEIFVNDGVSFDTSGLPEWDLLIRKERNADSDIDVVGETLPVRTVRIRHDATTRFNVAEVEIYGDGFVPRSSYTSALHRFSSPVNYGELRVSARRVVSDRAGALQEMAQAIVQVRTGADDSPETFFRQDRNIGIQQEVPQEVWESLERSSQTVCFRKDPQTGEIVEEMTKGKWRNLPPEEQASPCRDFIAGTRRLDVDNWSPWSRPLRVDSTGVFVQGLDLPSPRDYMQFRILFENGPGTTMQIDKLEIDNSPLLADLSVGELALRTKLRPSDGLTTTPPGVDTTFVSVVLTSFLQGELPGFTGLRVASLPPPVFMALEGGDPPSALLDPEVVVTAEGFDLHFDPITAENNQPLRVTYSQALVEYHTLIRMWLLSEGEHLPQPVVAGDASPDIGTNSLSVLATEVGSSVGLELSSRVITPNRDGINDLLVPAIALNQFADAVDVSLVVSDLSGRRVRTLFDGLMLPGRNVGTLGTVDLSWDGSTAGGGCRATGDVSAAPPCRRWGAGL